MEIQLSDLGFGSFEKKKTILRKLFPYLGFRSLNGFLNSKQYTGTYSEELTYL